MVLKQLSFPFYWYRSSETRPCGPNFSVVNLFSYFWIEKLSTQAHQTLQKFSDRLSILSLPVEIVQMLYTERVISKETLDEVNGLGGMLGDGPLKALCTTVSEDPNMLAKFAKVLMMSKETIAIAEDMLKEYSK